MMVDVTRKTYYSLVAHQRIVGFSCYSYMKLQVCTVIYDCYYHQTIRVQSGQCRMPLLLQAKYLQCGGEISKKPGLSYHLFNQLILLGDQIIFFNIVPVIIKFTRKLLIS